MEDSFLLKRLALELEYEIAAFVFKTDSKDDDLYLVQLKKLAAEYRTRAALAPLRSRDTTFDDVIRLVEQAKRRSA